MNNVIYIRFSHDLPTSKQNELRYRMELAQWKAHWREAEATFDYDAMDRLQVEFERVGLP